MGAVKGRKDIERDGRALELRLQGKKYREIAEEFGFKESSAWLAVRRAAERLNVQLPPTRKPERACPRCDGPITGKSRRCRKCLVAERKTSTEALCARCDTWKLHRDFAPAPTTGRGLRLWCKVCEYAAVKERGQREPEKKAARSAVAYALRKGTLRKGPCELRARGGCRGRIEAHHDDYKRKLDVRWVCAGHHHVLDRRRHVTPGRTAGPRILTM